jgi:peptide chain release factor 1
MWEKLKAQRDRYDEIERLIADPQVIAIPARYAALMKERGRLGRTVSRIRALEAARDKRTQAESLLAEAGTDPEMRALAEEERAAARKEEEELLHQLEDMLLTEDAVSHRNVLIEIRAGTGGEEAALFSADLFRMYSKYAGRRGWTVGLLNTSDTDRGGFRHVVFSVDGEDVYRHLRHESGVHRVQRVPETEAQGRIHTSTSTVAVLPEAEEVDVEINPADIEEELYCRSSGPGGQNVNKVASAVRLIHKSGLVVESCTERSQYQNRILAMRLLRTRLYEQEQSKQKEAMDAMRRSQIGTGDRSEKIRTYNFPQNRVTDHRIGVTLHQLDRILEGEIDELIDALLKAEKEKRLKALGVEGRPA